MTGGPDNTSNKGAPREHLPTGPGAALPVNHVALAGHLEYDRIMFFTDAVFAIAITLLIVDLPVQIERTVTSHHAAFQSGQQIRQAESNIYGFAISFAVIGVFWMAHHSLFRHIKAIDRPLMLLNLLFIGTIAFLPYPTELLSASSSSQKPAVIFYAVCAGSAGLVETVVWLYATRAGLTEGVDRRTQQLLLLRSGRVPVVFGLSILIAQFSARAAIYFWLAIAVSGWAINQYWRRMPQARPDGPDGERE